MHADGIDVGVSAIVRRWDLATSVYSEYLLSAEIGRYEKNYAVNLNLNSGWTPYSEPTKWKEDGRCYNFKNPLSHPWIN